MKGFKAVATLCALVFTGFTLILSTPFAAQASGTLPTAPTALSGTANSDGSITLTWTAPDSGCPNGCYYDVYSSTNDGSTWNTPDLATSTTWTGTYLTIGTAYTFEVTALNDDGQGPASNEVTITAYVPPASAPTGLQATPGNGEVSLSWTAPSSGCPCDYYMYYLNEGPDGTDTGGEPTYFLDTSTTSDITGLTNGDVYAFYVTALNGEQSAPSGTVEAVPEPAPPSAPTALSGTANSNGTITLTWTAPDSGCPNGCYYDVYSSTNGGSSWTGPYLATSTDWTGTYLNDGTAYTYEVTALNDGGQGPSSSQITITAR